MGKIFLQDHPLPLHAILRQVADAESSHAQTRINPVGTDANTIRQYVLAGHEGFLVNERTQARFLFKMARRSSGIMLSTM